MRRYPASKNMRRGFILSTIFCLAILLASTGVLLSRNGGTRDETRLEYITEAEASDLEILSDLKKEGIVNNWTGSVLFLMSAIGKDIEAGAYRLSRSMNVFELYHSLANPYMRYVKVAEGLRKEQIAELFDKKLLWEQSDKEEFLNAHLALNRPHLEGYYFPGTYLFPLQEEGLVVGKIMLAKFNEQVVKANKQLSQEVINTDTIVKIASLIQREAGGKSDMRLISGIIWNRMFAGMKLDIDATLQYAKGNEEVGWWPKVKPQDKLIDSPYNTYKYQGLPPTPIANPGKDAINAALNPVKTSCLFYLHDKRRQIHCSKTYEGHLANIRRYYGTRNAR
ncbi:MAG: endolytic transglycosylase MltG [bacterium]|nr:endolytic transglycosylase MltG [bacterium]